MIGSYYMECYNKIANADKHISDYTVMEMTGYYMTEYPNASMDKLMYDMENSVIPYVTGVKVKLILEVISI